jgi:N-acetylneuraminic acid mutarotase
MRRWKTAPMVLFTFAIGLTFILSCSNGGAPSESDEFSGKWTWIAGSDSLNDSGHYGTLRVPEESNVPQAREQSIGWIGNDNNLWLFGGLNWISISLFNDVWRFDGTYWTWMSGSNTPNNPGVYGPATSAVPGARYNSASWEDAEGRLWLFGGHGYDRSGTYGYLNDFWLFDGTYWTWISGSDAINNSGVYGSTASSLPGGRCNSVSWVGNDGSLWLFGGYGYDGSGTLGYLNDLWRFNGIHWTWISGGDTVNNPGQYGTKGTPAGSNVPGARHNSISWIDSNGYLWLFGGHGYDKSGTLGDLNDLWRFNGIHWTWISGGDTVNNPGQYGTKGTPAGSNVPGARNRSVSWVRTDGILWLFGGFGYDGSSTEGFLNDLWRFDGVQWTWMSGGDTVNNFGQYSTKGTPAESNVPGARYYSTSWTTTDGNLWLFGGYGYSASSGFDNLNDLWRYKP